MIIATFITATGVVLLYLSLELGLSIEDFGIKVKNPRSSSLNTSLDNLLQTKADTS
jgi:hypothetical protein